MCKECLRVDGRKPVRGEVTEQIYAKAGIIPVRRLLAPDLSSLRDAGANWESFFALTDNSLSEDPGAYEAKIQSQTAVLATAELVAPPVYAAIASWTGETHPDEFTVFPTDPSLIQSQQVCERYGIPRAMGAKTLIVKASGADRYAALVVPSNMNADMTNNTVTELLDARQISLARGRVTQLTGMELGSVTAIGLPREIPVFVDRSLIARRKIVTGSGVHRSKLLVPGAALGELPNVRVINGLGKLPAAA